jgi:hypothetical protein
VKGELTPAATTLFECVDCDIKIHSEIFAEYEYSVSSQRSRTNAPHNRFGPCRNRNRNAAQFPISTAGNGIFPRRWAERSGLLLVNKVPAPPGNSLCQSDKKAIRKQKFLAETLDQGGSASSDFVNPVPHLAEKNMRIPPTNEF